MNEQLKKAAKELADAADQVCPVFDAKATASTRWRDDLAPKIAAVRKALEESRLQSTGVVATAAPSSQPLELLHKDCLDLGNHNAIVASKDMEIAGYKAEVERLDCQLQMYARAWQRELGGALVVKANLIDSLVATTEKMRVELEALRKVHGGQDCTKLPRIVWQDERRRIVHHGDYACVEYREEHEDSLGCRTGRWMQAGQVRPDLSLGQQLLAALAQLPEVRS